MAVRSELRNVPTGAALSVGLAVALLTSTLPDAVLLPAVDRATPRAVGFAVVGGLVSLGWLCATGRTGRVYGRRGLIVLTVLALAGGFLAAALLPWWRNVAAVGLRGHWGLPYYPQIALVVAGCVLPIALPFGALVGVALGDGRRSTWTPFLLGVGTGWAVGPWFAEVLLGPVRVLQISALLAGTAGVLFTELGAIDVACVRLARGAAPALALLGAATLVAGRALGVELDRGSLPGPVLATCIAVVAAVGVWLPPRGSTWLEPSLLLAAAAAGSICLFPSEPSVASTLTRSVTGDLLRVLCVALAPGLALGLLLRSPGRELRLSLAPVVLVLLAPIVCWSLLPALGPRVLVAALAIPVALAMLPQRPVPIGGFALLAIAATAAALGVGPSPRAGSLGVSRAAQVSEGQVLEVQDGATERMLVAIDGRAPFGRSAGQQRRFAHLPILLNGAARSVLVVASGDSETARAAWMHGPRTLHWLRPISAPDAWETHAWSGSDPPMNGSERQFLAAGDALYDVIVLAPDPRADRRTALTGTVEFLELARSRLAADGTLCQWYDLADVHITDVRAVMASALTVFPHVYLVADHPRTRRACIGVLLRNTPLAVWPARIDDVLRNRPDVKADYETIGVDGLAIACMVFADRGLVELVSPDEAAVRDERPLLGVRRALGGDEPATRMRLGLDFLERYRREPKAWLQLEPEEYVRVSAIARERFATWQTLFAKTRADVFAYGFTGKPFDAGN